MNTLELKLELHKQIDSLGRTHLHHLYGEVHNIIQSEVDESHWNNLSDEERESILLGLKQAEAGKVIPHEQVMKNIKKKYGLS